MRAIQPRTQGFAINAADGVRTHYEVFGQEERTILFLPAWSIVHSRLWKMQVAYFARYFRVVTFDGRGNGQSERPPQPEAYSDATFVADALAVMDATQTTTADLVSVSRGALGPFARCRTSRAGAQRGVHCGRGAACPRAPAARLSGRQPLDTEVGWAKFNYPYWRKDYAGFLGFFFSQAANEPHSTKLVEDGVAWGLETDPETLIAATEGNALTADEAYALAKRVRCPVLVLHGDHDAVSPHTRGVALAEATGGTLVTQELV